MKFRLILTFLVTAWAWSAASAAAQANIQRGEAQRAGNQWEEVAECRAAMREASRLVVKLDFGSIRVKPAAGGNLKCQVRLRVYKASEVEARQYFRRYELALRPHEGGWFLRGAFPPGSDAARKSLSAEFEITVPTRTSLELETRGGEIEVGSLRGSIQAVTAGGDIRAGDAKGAVKLETASGSIEAGSIEGPLVARTAGGNIRVGDVTGTASLETSGGTIEAGMVSETLRAATAGGDLVLRGARGALEAQTAGGQIRIGEAGGSVVAQTAAGSIRLNGARGPVKVRTAGGGIDLLQLRNAVQAATAAGSIVAQIDRDLKSFSASRLETALGDIRIYLPASLPLNIDAAIDAAAGHKIISDFPLEIRSEGSEFAPSRVRGAGALNGGGEVLRVRTVGGNIEIRRLDAGTLQRLRAEQESYWKRWQERARAGKN